MLSSNVFTFFQSNAEAIAHFAESARAQRESSDATQKATQEQQVRLATAAA